MKMNLLVVPAMIFVAVFFMSFKNGNTKDAAPEVEKHDLGISADIQKIIDNSCYGCHNAESRNEKGRGKLMFESLDTLSVAKLIGKLADIGEEVAEDKMPPAKFLEFKPEAKLTQDQKNALIKWADVTGNSLLKK